MSVRTASLMKLPSFNDKYVSALRSSFLRFPENKLQIKVKGRNVDSPSRRRASVFVPLCNRHGVPSVLFTVRTKTVSSHKGHVSFPGGHQEAGETAQGAALREFHEEMYGQLHSVSTAGTGRSMGEGTSDGSVTGSGRGCADSGVAIIGECQTIPALTVSSMYVCLIVYFMFYALCHTYT